MRPSFFSKLSPTDLFDIAVLVLIPLLAGTISLVAQTSYLISIILFYVAPGIYLAARFSTAWQMEKSLIFTLATFVPFAIIVDYIGTTGGVWAVPESLFSFRFLGVIPIEDFVWLGAATWVITIMYIVLIDRGKQEVIDRRLKYLVMAGLFALAIFFALFASSGRELLTWTGPWAYLALGSAFFLPPVIAFLFAHPGFLSKCLPLIAYFLYLTAIFEVVATHLRQWIFTGAYLLPPLNLLGDNPIPWEELFFVGVIGPLAAVALYEYFDDNRK